MNVKKSISIIEKFLRRKVKYTFEESRNTFAMHIDVSPKVGTAVVLFIVTEDVVNLRATLPFRGTNATAAKLAELVCRINCHLSVGRFDYDFDSGEVRYSQDVFANQLKVEKGEALLRFLEGLVMAGELYAPCIALIALGIGEPEKVYNDAVAADEEKTIGTNDEKTVALDDTLKVAHVSDVALTLDDRLESDKDICMENAEQNPPMPVKNYMLDGLNVVGDFPIAKVEAAAQKFLSILTDGVDALPDRPGFNILLWGPPGTGKSEFVNYLGHKLGRKVVVKMGSDILSHYVGETEKSIREAFGEAEEGNAILFLDELDGVMQNRVGAAAGWEVSQVNEILHQMEHFKGIMIGATNFKDNLDPAVLRRFTYKLQFDFLDDSGKSVFFDRAFKTPLTETERNRLNRIQNLTPGDFRTVSQSLFYLDEVTDNAARLAALEKEAAMKDCGRKVCLGFSA